MKRLSKEEIEKAKAALYEWQAPDTLLAISEAVETLTLFNQAGYAGSAHLVVYLSNAGEYGTQQREIKASFFEATKPAHGKFESVWALWNGAAYKIV